MSDPADETVHPFDAAALETFRGKGAQAAVKVRRVLQATKDLLRSDLRGAQVLAVDGRSGRLDDGRAAARRLGELPGSRRDGEKPAPRTKGGVLRSLFRGRT